MSALGRFTVRVSAAFLPTEVRDRYREQWLGELRDAPEHGIPASEIALGSLKFAATYTRPALVGGLVTVTAIARRLRWAIALSLSASVLAVAQYGSIASFGGSVNDDLDFWISGLLALIFVYMVLAPLSALALLLAPRAIRTRAHIAVLLLVAATAVPQLRWWIDGQTAGPVANFYFTVGTIVYLIALVLIAVASVLIWREYKATNSRPTTRDRRSRMIESTAGGLLVTAAVVISWLDATSFWASRAPLEFALELSPATQAAFENWVSFKVQFETSVDIVLALWLAIGLLLAVAVAVSGAVGHASMGRTLLLTVGAVCLTLLSYAALVNLIQLAPSTSSPTVSLNLVKLIAQFGIVVVITALVNRELNPTTLASRSGLEDDQVHSIEIPAPAK